MNYIIMDMEWNQALGKTQMVQSPVLLRGEIIQIGAVKTDENFNFLDKVKINVRPKYYKVMNRHVQKITGITSTQLGFGETFPHAFERFRRWCGEDFRFITWGFDDIGILADNLELHGLPSDYGADYINLQLIYNDQVDGERQQWSLSDAAARLEIPLDAQAHDAFNDAWFTFEVLKKLDMEKGLANYAELASKVKNALRRDVITNVENCRKMLNDPRVRDASCPRCDNILRNGEWLNYGGGKKTTIASCPEHGNFFVKLTTKQMKESIMVSRSIYDADDETIAQQEAKLEKQRIARAKHEARKKGEKNDDNGDV